MGKLFNLKEWLTVTDAAQHLSIVFDEDVSVADTLRLALDGRLTLSVYFANNVKVKFGKVIKYEETEIDRLMREYIVSQPYPDDVFREHMPLEKNWELEDKIISIKGVWDLPMFGLERRDIEREYHNLIGVPVTNPSISRDRVFVERTDGSFCELQESFDNNEFQKGSMAALEILKEKIEIDKIDENTAQELLEKHKQERKKYLETKRSNDFSDDYFPAPGLPEDSVLVVRTDALREFERALSQGGNKRQVPGALSGSANSDGSLLRKSPYWHNLEERAEQAIRKYPDWREKQPRIQKTANLQDWLTKTIGVNNREADILKKILSDLYQELR